MIQENDKALEKKDFELITSSFPDGIDYAFAYGSGVFSQEDEKKHTSTSTTKTAETIKTPENKNQPMIDLIFSVSDVEAWHEQNLKQNPEHYAFIPRFMGPKFISFIQEKGAGCYFNPMVSIDDKTVGSSSSSSSSSSPSSSSQLLKYGVISQSRLKSDLIGWDSLYISGRMQKPIATIQTDLAGSLTDEITNLQEQYNLRYAIHTALLLLPLHGNFNIEEKRVDLSLVFESIAGISYKGDPRLTAGAEDPQKIHKLVHSNGQLGRFQSLYENQMDQMMKSGLISFNKDENTGFLELDLISTSTRRELYKNLPKNVQHHTKSFSQCLDSTRNHNSVDELVSFAEVLSTTLGKIVAPAARIQSAKGIITAGIHKSILYAGAKLSKGALRNTMKKR